MNSRLIISMVLAAAVSTPSVAMAETIRATSGFGPDHPIAVSIYPEVSTRLSEFTDGAWDLQDTPSDLVAPNEMSAALRDGVTDFGALVIPYFSTEFAEAALPSELGIVGSNSLAISSATTEYLVTCTECQAEFTQHGQVFLGSDATPPYNLLTVKPIRKAADLRGVRIRTGAPLFAAFISGQGGVVVQLPSSELLDMLSRGGIAGTFSGDQEIVVNKLADLVHYVTEIGLGVYNGTAATTASRVLWDRMGPEDRAALARASQYGLVKGINGFLAEAKAAREMEGIEFIEMDNSLKEAKQAFVDKQLANAPQLLESRGVTDAQAKIDRYVMLVNKWEGLITKDMTPESLAQLRYDEIFSKLDMASYGQ